MKAWVLTDENGRVTATAISGKLDGGAEVDLPGGYDPERQQDWRLVGGQWVHDPVPIVHDVTLEEQVAALSEAVMGLLMGGTRVFKAFIRIQYRMGRITAEQVRELVTLNRLTQAEADELLGGAET